MTPSTWHKVKHVRHSAYGERLAWYVKLLVGPLLYHFILYTQQAPAFVQITN